VTLSTPRSQIFYGSLWIETSWIYALWNKLSFTLSCLLSSRVLPNKLVRVCMRIGFRVAMINSLRNMQSNTVFVVLPHRWAERRVDNHVTALWIPSFHGIFLLARPGKLCACVSSLSSFFVRRQSQRIFWRGRLDSSCTPIPLRLSWLLSLSASAVHNNSAPAYVPQLSGLLDRMDCALKCVHLLKVYSMVLETAWNNHITSYPLVCSASLDAQQCVSSTHRTVLWHKVGLSNHYERMICSSLSLSSDWEV